MRRDEYVCVEISPQAPTLFSPAPGKEGETRKTHAYLMRRYFSQIGPQANPVWTDVVRWCGIFSLKPLTTQSMEKQSLSQLPDLAEHFKRIKSKRLSRATSAKMVKALPSCCAPCPLPSLKQVHETR